MTFKRNLHSLAVLLLIRGGFDCPLLRQTKDRDAMFLPEMLFLNLYASMQHFNYKSPRVGSISRTKLSLTSQYI
jgi:hypothetical protein